MQLDHREKDTGTSGGNLYVGFFMLSPSFVGPHRAHSSPSNGNGATCVISDSVSKEFIGSWLCKRHLTSTCQDSRLAESRKTQEKFWKPGVQCKSLCLYKQCRYSRPPLLFRKQLKCQVSRCQPRSNPASKLC